jgi:type IX secretion system PorP/SprF family membrane protein
MKIKFLSILIFIWGWSINLLHTQNNLHYSQFYNAPMFLNPALTGQIGEDLFRLNGHARNQWSGLTGADGKFLYETKSGGADLSLLKRRLGIGLYAMLDDAGGGIFKTTQIYPSLSYSFIMGDNILSFGAQGLYNMTSVDPSDPRWGTFPQPLNPNTSYFDANAGVNFKWDLYYLTADLGVASNNLLQAPQRFTNTGTQGVPTPRSYKTYALLDFDMTERMKLLPGFYGSFQALSTNFVMGSNFSYKILKGGTYGNSLILGIWLRTNDGNLESVIPKFGMKMNKLQIMGSYDANVSMSKSGNSKYLDGITNTFEISIIFTGKPKVAPPLLEDDFILNPRY